MTTTENRWRGSLHYFQPASVRTEVMGHSRQAEQTNTLPSPSTIFPVPPLLVLHTAHWEWLWCLHQNGLYYLLLDQGENLDLLFWMILSVRELLFDGMLTVGKTNRTFNHQTQIAKRLVRICQGWLTRTFRWHHHNSFCRYEEAYSILVIIHSLQHIIITTLHGPLFRSGFLLLSWLLKTNEERMVRMKSLTAVIWLCPRENNGCILKGLERTERRMRGNQQLYGVLRTWEEESLLLAGCVFHLAALYRRMQSTAMVI